MKHYSILVPTGLLCLVLGSAYGQFTPQGGMGAARKAPFSASTAKLFGEHTAFAADLEVRAKGTSGEIVMPGRMAFDQGKSRFEMNLAMVKGTQMPPEAAAQMKSMGMDVTATINRPDKKISYTVYPSLKAFTESPLSDQEAGGNPADFKVQMTELGKEVVEGHPCIKSKAVVTGKDGAQQESTVWNATDLRKFPIKLEVIERGEQVTMLFRNPSLTKPDAALFEPPAGFQKYDSMMSLMQQEMMKRMGPRPGTMPMPPQRGGANPPTGR